MKTPKQFDETGNPVDLNAQTAPNEGIPGLMPPPPAVLALETNEAINAATAINPHGSGL